MRRRTFWPLICASACAVALFVACTSSRDYKDSSASGVIWGTEYHIIYNGEGCEADVMAVVADSLRAVDEAANMFNPSSEVSRLNTAGSMAAPSQVLQCLIELSRRVSRASGGAFDPTVGPLVDAWGFGTSSAYRTAPSDSIVAKTLALIGIDKVVMTADTLHLEPGMRLDLSAIAKGYGVDCAARALEALGITDYMVEIGGEVRVRGLSPRGTPWRIQVDAPIPDTSGRHERLTVIELADGAMATSGNYRNYRTDAAGNTVYHTISPVTGRPAVSDLVSATVIADDCATADALATASMVLGLDSATTLLRNYPTVRRALLVTKSADAFNIHDITPN